MSIIRLVTFDVTNTIMKPRNVGITYTNAAKIFGITADPDSVMSSFKKHYKILNKMYPNFGVRHGMTSKQWWCSLVTQTFMEQSQQESSTKLNELTDYLYELYKRGDPYEILPYSVEVLEKLRKTRPNIKVVVVSNFDERLPGILNDLKLSQYFDFVLLSVERGFCKPDRRIFETALIKTGAKASEAVHIGDSTELDYLAARNAGMNALLLPGNQTVSDERVELKHVLRNLTELQEKLVLFENS